MTENNDKEVSGLDDFFDEDPTDELPVLNLQDVDPELARRVDAPSSDDTSEREPPDFSEADLAKLAEQAEQTHPPLHQMELEIQALQSKWYEIEAEVRGRDEFIEKLEAELRTERSSLEGLRTELDAANSALDDANSKCERLAAENAEQLEISADLERRARDAQAQLDAQQEESAHLHNELSESKNLLARVIEASARLETDHRDQQTVAEELANRLCAANEELREQTSRAESLQANLDQTKTKLERVELDANKLFEEHREHLQIAEDQQNQIRRLRAAHNVLRVQKDDLANYIAGRKSDWDMLQAEVALQRDANSSLQNAIDAKSQSLTITKREKAMLLADIEKQRIDNARISTELSDAVQMLAREQARRSKLERQLAANRQHDEALEMANAQLAKMTLAQRTLTEQLDDKTQEIDKLKHSLNQLHTEHNEALSALKKQREIIQHMENEVRAKLEAITVIGHKTRRKKGKLASIHRLDVVRAKNPPRRRASGLPESSRMMVALNHNKNKEYRIEPGTITIGRGKGNDIRLHHHFISRYHAQIFTDADGSVIEDLGSKNGVLVNAEPVDRRRLRDGDLVDIGEMQFKFVDPVDRTGEHKTH